LKIGIIQASTQIDKNDLIFNMTKQITSKYGYEVINFGVFENEEEVYSYTEIALLTSLLLSSKSVDFVITGCSSGQGMNMACNSLPNVLCGFIQNPQDAFLFGRINDGNAISLPLGLGFGWLGELNLEYSLEKLFDGEFGIGYPEEVAERKIKETQIVKMYNQKSKKSFVEFLNNLDQNIIDKILKKKNIIDYVLNNTIDEEIIKAIKKN
jgi:ribose 5-phosphate isomerase RpiB